MKPIIAAAFLALAPAAFGHGGEDHSAPSPAVSQDVAPRATAATEDFEAVAVLEGKHLVVYVDRFASNEPVAQAKVEIEVNGGAGLKGLATEGAPGTYVMDLAAPLAPARHALTISIETADGADLLSAMLDTSQAAPGAAHVHGWGEWVIWIVAALLVLASGALLAVRHNRKKTRGL